MAYSESNGDVTSPWKVKVMISGVHYLENGWRYKQGYNGARIGNGCHVPGAVTGPSWPRYTTGIQIQIYWKSVRDSIGQMMCSFERCLVYIHSRNFCTRLQGTLKKEPLGKIRYLWIGSKFFRHIVIAYRGGFKTHILQNSSQYLVAFKNYSYLNLNVLFLNWTSN